MILMGDEVRRTQGGNNNAYCQDNEISWFDWSLVEKHADVHRFVSCCSPAGACATRSTSAGAGALNELIRQANKAWHGVKVDQPDWGEHSHAFAFEVELRQEGISIYTILNAYWEPLEFELPPVGDGARPWRRWIDTALDSPQDISPWEMAAPLSGCTYRAAARSVVVLLAGL